MAAEDTRGGTLKVEERKSSFDHATGGRFPGDFEVQSIFLTSPSFKDPEIIVDLRYLDNKHWPNYGHVEIVSNGPNGFSQFTTHQENPLQYAKDRMSEGFDGVRDLSKYKLVIKK